METNLIQRLRAYCRIKSGADVTLITFGENRPTYRVLHGFLLSFARFYLDETPVRLEVRCDEQRFRQMQTTGVPVTVSERMKWETSGWQWVEVALDDFATENQLNELIDGSYDLVVGELNEHDRQLINLATENRGPKDILARLIDLHQLSYHREAIEQLSQNAVLLVTSPVDEAKLLLGQSRVGGVPDLPSGWAWPTFNDRHLAFLAQINLAEIEPSIEKQSLPTAGILYFFSAFGWITEEGEHDIPWEHSGEPGFSQVLFFSGEVSVISRHDKPDDLVTFKSAAVRYKRILSMPRASAYARDPAVTTLGWNENDCKKLDDLHLDFALASRYPDGHQLLSYADSIQTKVTRPGNRLLFQIYSDYFNANMMWGDGGMIYFIIDETDLNRADFSSVTADLHSG